MKKKQFAPIVGAIFFSLACSLSFLHKSQDQSSQPLPTPTAQFFSQVDLGAIDSSATIQPPTNTPAIVHITMPSEQPEQGKLIYDVESSVTPQRNALHMEIL